MTVAVTAASGKLGSEIVKALVEQGVKTIALARTVSKAEHLGVEVRPGDYTDRAALEDSLRGIDAVLLVSGMDAPDKRIGQHRNVIEAAKAAGVRKIVSTSVQGADDSTAFSPIIQSNRQTEQDVRDSGLEWSIGRNGIYIEPDVEYIESYKAAGAIRNCAGDGKCGYTTRPELGFAYAQVLIDDAHNGQTYNLHGDLVTQTELTDLFNSAFGTSLTYEAMPVDAYRAERIAELGDFIGGVIAGIYDGIRTGANDNVSDFAKAAGRSHQSWGDYFASVGTK